MPGVQHRNRPEELTTLRTSNVAVQEAFGDAVTSGDLAALDDLVAPDCVDHNPVPGQARHVAFGAVTVAVLRGLDVP
jgi:hypothetical protein